jgi:hypothetical protein
MMLFVVNKCARHCVYGLETLGSDGVYDVFKVFFIKKYIKKIYFYFFKLCFYIIIPKQFKNIKKFILNKFIFSKFT